MEPMGISRAKPQRLHTSGVLGDLGSSSRKGVQVQLLSSPLKVEVFCVNRLGVLKVIEFRKLASPGSARRKLAHRWARVLIKILTSETAATATTVANNS